MRTIMENMLVIDWTQWHAGPYAALLLADLGAKVIHVEDPVHGDAWRGVRQLLGVSLELPNGRNFMLELLNRNKLGMTLNVQQSKGYDIMCRLIKMADVFVTNFRGVERVGLGYETVRQLNPKIVYAVSTGFGLRGPDREVGSLEFTAYGRSGAMLSVGEDDKPQYLMPGGADRITGLYLAYGIVAALLGRERLGVGQMVTTSQLGSMMGVQEVGILPNILLDKEFNKHAQSKASNPLTNWYRCKEGRWLMLCLFQSAKHWIHLCRALDRADLADDPRFDDEQKRGQNSQDLIAILDGIFSTKTYEEWDRAFKQVGGLVYSAINHYRDLARDEQALANDYIVNWNHPELGAIKWVGHPVEFSDTPQPERSPAPEFGQHTEHVLVDMLGLTWDEVERLRAEGVI